MEKALVREIEAQGYQGRIVSIRRLKDLKEAIENHYKQGLLNEELYKSYLTGFVFEPPQGMPNARSLIIVAYQDPQVHFTFNWGGKKVRLVVPPTYLHGRQKDRRVEEALARLLEAQNYRIVRAAVPDKLLAVSSGLARYGRNNIAFVGRMGSFHRLVVFYSDLQCEQDEWIEPKSMERCERCLACLQSCPTGAIRADRFLLRAELCLTFLNEKPGRVAFPEWVQAAWHNCLVGCMQCQMVCPENRAVLDLYEEGEEFSTDETELLLKELKQAELPTELKQKLERGGLFDFLDFLPRNLRVLLPL